MISADIVNAPETVSNRERNGCMALAEVSGENFSSVKESEGS